MLQLPQRLRLDLTNTLAGDRELLADFLQRVSVFMPKRMRSTHGERIEQTLLILVSRKVL